MNKEQQDKFWNGLSKEKQKSARGMYKQLTRPLDPAKSNAQNEADVMSFALETTFGSHNLNPKQIKKEGWIVIYSCGDPIAGRIIYKTKEEAKKDAVGPNNPQIVKIEWE